MTLSTDELLPVALNTILEGGKIDCDFYLIDDHQRSTLYRGRSYPFTVDDMRNLKQRGVKCLYISASDAERYRDHLQSQIVNDNSVPPLRRLEIIREASRTVVEEAWQRGGIDATVWVTRELAEQLTALLTGEGVVFQDLLDLMLFDYSAYAHATNVCSFAVVIAKAYGIYDRESLIQIAKGALLHDIGKQLLVNEKKPSKHDPKSDLREHPLTGFKKFSANQEMSWGSLMMIYQHHEQIDGHGYPTGIEGEEIHEWAKICAVANFYEKQRRQYQGSSPANLHKLYTAIVNKSGTLLDEEVTACLLSIIENEQMADA
jgi:HD-GYP domain-containing protein (c-di-GMP phosphodiesterase class II)